MGLLERWVIELRRCVSSPGPHLPVAVEELQSEPRPAVPVLRAAQDLRACTAVADREAAQLRARRAGRVVEDLASERRDVDAGILREGGSRARLSEAKEA